MKMETHKWLHCNSPDDVLVIKRNLFGEVYDQSIEFPCKHPHLIVCTDNLSDMTFEDKEKIRKMLDGPRRTPNPA